jgi:hypothetical protein
VRGCALSAGPCRGRNVGPRRPKHSTTLVVIGARAAGVSAAIEYSDIQLDVVVLEAALQSRSQIDQISHTVRNVAPVPDANALVDVPASHLSILGDRRQLDLTGSGASSRKIPKGSFSGDVTIGRVAIARRQAEGC